MGRNGRLKPGKLLNVIGHVSNMTRLFSISLFVIQRAGFVQTPGVVIDSSDMKRMRKTHFIVSRGAGSSFSSF